MIVHCVRAFRLKKILRVLARFRSSLRRFVWFWRFKKRVSAKQEASEQILFFLVKVCRANRHMQKHIKRYMYMVRKIQRFVRRSLVRTRGQAEVLYLQWLAIHPKDSEGTMPNQEKSLRILVLRQDLRQRKLAHAQAIDRWWRAKAEYERYRQHQEMMDAARQLLGSEMSVGEPVTMITPMEESHSFPRRAAVSVSAQRRGVMQSGAVTRIVQKPVRPVFRLMIPPECFVKLNAKLKAKVRSMRMNQMQKEDEAEYKLYSDQLVALSL